MRQHQANELTQSEIFDLLERTAGEDHPNPHRIGCPGEETLERFASNPKLFEMRDPLFEHLANCSPCFRFVRERRAAKEHD